MTVHLFLMAGIIGLGILVYYNFKPSPKVNKWYLFISLSMVFVVQGLRADTVGRDTAVYLRSFLIIDSPGFKISSSSWEPLYLLFNKVVGLFTNNPQFLLICSSAFILTGLGLFIYKSIDNNKNSAFWPVFFFMCFTHYLNSMNLLRQYLAMAVVIQIYWVLRDGKTRKKYVVASVLLIIGTLFHRSALLCALLFLPFLLKKIDKKMIIMVGIGIIFALLLYSKLLTIVFSIFPQYKKYTTSFRIEGEGFGAYYVLYLLFNMAFVFLTLLYLDPKKNNNQEIYKLLIITSISIGLILMKTRVSLAHRTGYYFDIFNIILYQKVLNKANKNRTILYYLMFCYGLFCFVYTLPSIDRACVPYLFFWQH